MPLHVSAAMDAAWQRYRQALEDARTTLYGWELTADPSVQKAAHYGFHLLQAMAFNMTIGPRQDYPAFQVHTFGEPTLYLWALNNPDFLYRMLYLDGARTYRVWGRRKTTVFLGLQIFSHFYGAPEADMKCLSDHYLEDFAVDPDGRFEIILSPEAHEGNWIKLDPTAPRHFVMSREAFADWERDEPTEIHIERIDDGPAKPFLLSEEEMIERIDSAARMVSFISRRFMVGAVTRNLAAYGRHSFFSAPSGANSGSNPQGQYWQLIYALEPDEALLIEAEIPPCKYWGIQLADVFVQTTEYLHHQSSLNGTQARLDKDAKFRAVIAHRDPGVPNWLDPVGNAQGVVMFRRYKAESNPVPVVRKVEFDEIGQHLPPDTPRVSLQERARILRARRLAGQRRYGY